MSQSQYYSLISIPPCLLFYPLSALEIIQRSFLIMFVLKIARIHIETNASIDRRNSAINSTLSL